MRVLAWIREVRAGLIFAQGESQHQSLIGNVAGGGPAARCSHDTPIGGLPPAARCSRDARTGGSAAGETQAVDSYSGMGEYIDRRPNPRLVLR